MVEALMNLYIKMGWKKDISEFEAPVFDAESLGTFKEFGQDEFVGIDTTLPEEKEWVSYLTYWHESGKIYIPNDCEKEQCKVHIAFHDCGGSADEIAEYSEYNEFAASNKIIMVYPETECWATTWHTKIISWNDTNHDEYWNTKDGLYSRAIMAIICRVTSENEWTSDCPESAALYSIGLSLLIALTLW